MALRWAVAPCTAVVGLAGCSSAHVPPYLRRQSVPYVVVDGQATTLGGEGGTIGEVAGPLLVQVGHEVAVKPAGIGWPAPFSSDPSILTKVSGDGLGVFKAQRAGTARLLMTTTACVRPSPRGCVLVDVVVTATPVPRTTSPPVPTPTTADAP